MPALAVAAGTWRCEEVFHGAVAGRWRVGGWAAGAAAGRISWHVRSCVL